MPDIFRVLEHYGGELDQFGLGPYRRGIGGDRVLAAGRLKGVDDLPGITPEQLDERRDDY